MKNYPRSVRLRKDQLQMLEKEMKGNPNMSASELLRLLVDEALSARNGRQTRAEGFAAGWFEARYQASGMVRQAFDTALSSLPTEPPPARSSKRRAS